MKKCSEPGCLREDGHKNFHEAGRNCWATVKYDLINNTSKRIDTVNKNEES